MVDQGVLMHRRSRGQASAETMLLISVVSVTIVAAAATLVPLFRSGVEDLGGDIEKILSTGSVGGGGGSGPGSGSGAATPDDYQNAADTMGNDPDDIGSPFVF